MLYNIIVILTQTLIMPMTFLASCSIKQHQTSLALTILQTEELDNNFVDLYAVAGLCGVYTASTAAEGMYLIEVLDNALAIRINRECIRRQGQGLHPAP